MSAELPEPLVPAEVDLRDLQWMPLDVTRLRDSGLASDETPEACWAAVLLWCAAWHQVPAASVPDNEQWLAKACGYVARGRIDPAWKQVRDGALRNFVMCSDGRLYHSTLATKALESWQWKQTQRARTAAATAAREARKRERDVQQQANVTSNVTTQQSATSRSHEDQRDEQRNVQKNSPPDRTGPNQIPKDKGEGAVLHPPSPTRAGAAVLRMKQAGLTAGISPSHPKLLALLEAGITDDELADAAADAVAKGKPFAYALATAEGRRRDAKTTPLPARGTRTTAFAEHMRDRADQLGGGLVTAKRTTEPETIDVQATAARVVG